MRKELTPREKHNKIIGMIGEEIAAHYLELKGMQIVGRNVETVGGEIDILAEDGEDLVFCEVKTRENLVFGPPECAITARKQLKMRRSAKAYLASQDIDDQPCRFDVVAILLTRGQPEITHFKDAINF